jgi:hypothetical protein
MFSWIFTNTRNALAARLRQAEQDLQDAEVLRLRMQERLQVAHFDFRPGLLVLYRELSELCRGAFPAGHDPYAPVISPTDREIRIREMLQRNQGRAGEAACNG